MRLKPVLSVEWQVHPKEEFLHSLLELWTVHGLPNWILALRWLVQKVQLQRHRFYHGILQ